MLRFFTHVSAMGLGCSMTLYVHSLADGSKAPLIASHMLATLGSGMIYLILSTFEGGEK